MKTIIRIIAAFALFAALPAASQSPPFNSYSIATLGGNCSVQGSIPYQNTTGATLCTPTGSGSQVLSYNSGSPAWTTIAGTGSVTSVGLSMPSQFSVTGSPVTTAGTLTAAWASQTANTFLAAPNGSAGAPTFRSILTADLPTIPVSKGGTNATSASGTALDNITGFAGTGIMRRTGAGTYTQGTTVSIAEGGTGTTSAGGTLVDNISGFAGTGLVRRTGAGTYTQGTIVSIAEGGTGTTSAGGTLVDNISGFAGTGIVRRTGAGTYTQGTQVSTAEIADSNVTTAKIADSNVTTAKIADANVTIAKMAAGNVPGKVKLVTTTVSGSAFLSFQGVFSSQFDHYSVTLYGCAPSVNDALLVMQIGNGGTYRTTNYDYSFQNYDITGGATIVGATAQGQSRLGAPTSNAVAGIEGEVNFYNVNLSSELRKWQFNTDSTSSANFNYSLGFGRNTLSTAAITDVRFYYNTGTISCTATVYGQTK